MATLRYIASGKSPNWPQFPATQRSRTFDVIKAAGDQGITREEVCTQSNLPKQRVWFYLSELRRQGLIKRMGEAVDPASLSPEDSLLFALGALENALVAHATKNGTTPDLERQFLRYSKLKARALQSYSEHGESPSVIKQKQAEAKVAMKLCLGDIVKMVL